MLVHTLTAVSAIVGFALLLRVLLDRMLAVEDEDAADAGELVANHGPAAALESGRHVRLG